MGLLGPWGEGVLGALTPGSGTGPSGRGLGFQDWRGWLGGTQIPQWGAGQLGALTPGSPGDSEVAFLGLQGWGGGEQGLRISRGGGALTEGP